MKSVKQNIILLLFIFPVSSGNIFAQKNVKKEVIPTPI